MAEALNFLVMVVGVIAIGIGLTSVTSLQPTEMALKYNWLFKTMDTHVMTEPGLVFTGPLNTLIRFPKTIQTLEYNEQYRDLLDGRTQDGLPLILGLSFQYRLLPDGIYKLYHTYENEQGDYEKVYKLVGMHIITELATKFTAYQFFNEKQKNCRGDASYIERLLLEELVCNRRVPANSRG